MMLCWTVLTHCPKHTTHTPFYGIERTKCPPISNASRLQSTIGWTLLERKGFQRKGFFPFKLTLSASGDLNEHYTSRDDAVYNPRHRTFMEYRDTEEHASYRRVDMSEEHAASARRSFLSIIADGEGSMNLALAALYIAAEDDAIVSHSTVQFPIEAFQKRLHRLAMDVGTGVVLPISEERKNSDDFTDNEVILSAIIKHLFHGTVEKDALFCPPSFGRSNISSSSVVQHPGVWESPKMAYLHEALITKKSIPSVLAIILSDVLNRLFESGLINFVARIDCQRKMDSVPSATVVHGISRDLVARNQSALGAKVSSMNMCTSDMLVESLAYLKRSYWPFEWDGLRGGFPAAARTLLDGSENAEIEAIARTARHRLSRGIWTSPGAGDLSRAIAASERLVIIGGKNNPYERRDLGVLYCHAGRFAEAWAELSSYASTFSSVNARRWGGDLLNRRSSGKGNAAARNEDQTSEYEDTFFLDRLLTFLKRNTTEEERGLVNSLDLEEGIRRCERNREQSRQEVRFLPLTW